MWGCGVRKTFCWVLGIFDVGVVVLIDLYVLLKFGRNFPQFLIRFLFSVVSARLIWARGHLCWLSIDLKEEVRMKETKSTRPLEAPISLHGVVFWSFWSKLSLFETRIECIV